MDSHNIGIKYFSEERNNCMKKLLNSKAINCIYNLIVHAASILYLLIDKDMIRIPGSVIYDEEYITLPSGEIQSYLINPHYTDEFLEFLKIMQLVLMILGVALAVYNTKMSKQYKKLQKLGCNLSTICAGMYCAFIFGMGSATIFCYPGLAGALLMAPFFQEDNPFGIYKIVKA